MVEWEIKVEIYCMRQKSIFNKKKRSINKEKYQFICHKPTILRHFKKALIMKFHKNPTNYSEGYKKKLKMDERPRDLH